MIIAFIWVFFAFAIAFVFGVARTIGFWASFLVSLVFSPIIGLIITLFFETNEKKTQREKLLSSLANTQRGGTVNDLQLLIRMKESGQITDEEFAKLKAKIIS